MPYFSTKTPWNCAWWPLQEELRKARQRQNSSFTKKEWGTGQETAKEH